MDKWIKVHAKRRTLETVRDDGSEIIKRIIGVVLIGLKVARRQKGFRIGRLDKVANKYSIGVLGAVIAVIAVSASVPFILSHMPSASVPNGGGGGPSNFLNIGTVYPNFATLKSNSTIVVLASVENVNATYCTKTSIGEDCGALLNTDFHVNVTSYLKGGGPANIFVADSYFKGDPLLTVGSEYVLFLTNNYGVCAPSPPPALCTLPPTPLSITYYPLGGPQGKFLVQNGLVYGFKTLYPQDDNWIKVDANGEPLNQFMAMVQTV